MHIGQKKNYCMYYAFDVFIKMPKLSFFAVTAVCLFRAE